jgi:hypothetical protein
VKTIVVEYSKNNGNMVPVTTLDNTAGLYNTGGRTTGR